MDNEVKNPPRGIFPMLLTLGPGIVITGGVIGSGELIITPLQAAKFGFVLLWAVIISCLIKYFLQVEVGRHCIVHQRTIFESLNACTGPKFRGTSWIVLLFMLAWTLAQIGAVGMVGALAGLLHGLLPLKEGWSSPIWAVIVVCAIQAVLWKGLYRHLERAIITLVLGFSFSVLIALAMLQGTDYALNADDILSGLTFSLGDAPQLAAYAVISLMGALGVAATELFVYSYWVLEKGYANYVGPPDSEGWQQRARGWIRTLQIDAGLATLLTTTVTVSYFLLGCAILFRQGKTPEGMGVVDQMALIYTDTFGAWSHSLFLFGAFCTLTSTVMSGAAANGRAFADLFCSLGFLDRNRPKDIQRSHRIVQSVFLGSLLILFLWIQKPPATLVVLSGYLIAMFGTPLAIIGICWLAFKTDLRVRMSRITAVLLLCSVTVILACVLFALLVQIGVFKGA